MDKIYILAGIEGMPMTTDKNIFTIDRIVARDILSGDDDRFPFDEIVDNDIEILGLPDWFLDDCYDLNSMYYNVKECKFDGSGDSYDVGLLPIYYSDNPSKMPDYRYDSENNEAYYLGDIDSSSVANESIRVSLCVGKEEDDYASRFEFSALLRLTGGLEILAKVYDYVNYISNTFDSNGNILENTKYFLSSDFGIYGDDGLEKFKNSELAIIKTGNSEQITEFITDNLHIVNGSYLPEGATLITGSSCKALVFCCSCMVDSKNNWNIVVSPSVVRILNELFVYCYSLETKNIKLFISNKMRVDTLLDFVKTFTFMANGERAIGFSEFNGDDNYKLKLNKCIEITNIIESNDTSHRLFNDIWYLVDELNQIGFNIELY